MADKSAKKSFSREASEQGRAKERAVGEMKESNSTRERETEWEHWESHHDIATITETLERQRRRRRQQRTLNQLTSERQSGRWQKKTATATAKR